MKKFALIAATLICFAGCARNDTGEMGATETPTDTTATGASAPSQTGTDASMDTNAAAAAATYESSTLSQDTNGAAQPSSPQTTTPPPEPPAQDPSQQNQPSPQTTP